LDPDYKHFKPFLSDLKGDSIIVKGLNKFKRMIEPGIMTLMPG